jgi:GNAT superfamily N-acetyltransferase
VPRGRLAAVQTFLEMREKPPLRPAVDRAEWALERFAVPDVERYKALFHLVGDEHLWALRLLLSDEELLALFRDAQYEIYILRTPHGDEGLLELDFRIAGECEVGLFGVAAPLIGTGAARSMMNRALEIAWGRPIQRFWLHTCTLDHPRALDFYQRSGFTPYERKCEIFPDPRVLGLTRNDAAPHVPIL